MKSATDDHSQFSWLRALISILGALAVVYSTLLTAETDPRDLDWVPRSEMTPEQLANCPVACSGAYIQQYQSPENSNLDPRRAEITASSETTVIDQQEGVVTAEGRVTLRNGWRELTANRAVIDQESGVHTISGDLKLREPGLLILGDSATINSATNEFRLQNPEFVLHDSRIHGEAEEIGKLENGDIYINNAAYSTCEPGREAWQLVAGSVEMDTEKGAVIARDVRIEVHDVPVLYSPYLSYPLDDSRKTGLLYPEGGTSSENGLDVSFPYYINIAENYDATISPRWLEYHGLSLGVEGRLLSKSSSTTVAGAFLADDRAESTSDLSYRNKDRWFASVDHEGAWGDHWLTRVDFSRTSDRAYLDQIGDDALSSYDNSHLNQLASVSYANDWFEGSLQTRRYQSVSDLPTPFEQLPTFDLYSSLPIVDGVNADIHYHFSRFDRTLGDLDPLATSYQVGADGVYVTGSRQRIEVNIRRRVSSTWGYIEPEVGFTYLGYDLDEALAIGSGDKSPSASIPRFSLTAGLIFDRMLDSGALQTLEPVIKYSYAEPESQLDMPVFDTTLRTKSFDALLDGDVFAGLDRIDDSHRVTIGLSTEISRSDSMPASRFSIGQTYYLDDREAHIDPFLLVGRADQTFESSDPRILESRAARETGHTLSTSSSSVVGEGEIAFNQNWSAIASAVYRAKESQLDRIELGVRYRNPESGAIANFTYHHSDGNRLFRDLNNDAYISAGELFSTDVEQADISAFVPVSPQWTLIGRWNQDITNDRNLELFGGVRYESCCWNATLLWRKWLDRDDLVATPERDLETENGIFLSVQLMGLAGIGDSLDSILGRSIEGYEPPR